MKKKAVLLHDPRSTGIRPDGTLWLPPYHWLIIVNQRIYIGGIN